MLQVISNDNINYTSYVQVRCVSNKDYNMAILAFFVILVVLTSGSGRAAPDNDELLGSIKVLQVEG